MRSPSRTRRADLARWALAALASSASACGGAAIGTAPDRVLAGPQGAVGQFVVECGFDHLAGDDPIVHPGHPGASHLHQFFGAVGVGADSTYAALIRGATTCGQRADTAAYWAPVLLDGERRPIEAIRSVAYYRAGPEVEPTLVEPYPPGLMLVGGDPRATEPQPVSVVAWTCGTGSLRSPTPPDCTAAPSLRMIVTYPDCWNGVELRSSNWSDPRRRHAAYSTGGVCPDGFPVHIPQLQFAIDYPPVPASELGALALSSGDILSGHADFWNTWDQAKLEREVAHCIHRDLVCNVSG